MLLSNTTFFTEFDAESPVEPWQDVPCGSHRSIAMVRQMDQNARDKMFRWKASGSPLVDMKLNGSWSNVRDFFRDYLATMEALCRSTKSTMFRKTLEGIPEEEVVAMYQATSEEVH